MVCRKRPLPSSRSAFFLLLDLRGCSVVRALRSAVIAVVRSRFGRPSDVQRVPKRQGYHRRCFELLVELATRPAQTSNGRQQ